MTNPVLDRTRRLPLRLFVLTLLSMLLSCCAVGPDFKRPEPPSTTRYTVDTLHSEQALADDTTQHLALGEKITADWWTLFHSEVLNDVIRQALAGNRSLIAAQSSLAQAQDLVAAQEGRRDPQVDLTGGIGRQKYGAEFLGSLATIPPFTYFAVGPSVSYVLDYTGGVARSIEQQRALAEYQRQQLNAAYLALTGNVVMQAMSIASARQQITAVDTILDEDRRNLELVKSSFEVGAVTRTDVLSADSQLAGDATLLPSLRQQLSAAQHALAILLGHAPADWMAPGFDLAQLELPPVLPVSLPSALVHQRPDILAAEAQLHAATAAVGVATSNLYPHINLTASIGQQSAKLGQLLEHSSEAWSLAAGLVGPIFDGGTLRAEQRAAVAAMHTNLANYQQTVLQAFGQVADLLEALDHDAERLEAQQRALVSAQGDMSLARISYHEGAVGVLQVLNAERQYQQARLGYIRAQVQRYIDTAQLFLALGGTTPDTRSADAATPAKLPCCGS